MTPNRETPCDGNYASCLFVTLALLIAALCLVEWRFVADCNIDHDEVQHSHMIWAMNHGIMPYRDVHQIQLPMLWFIGMPIMRCLPESIGTVFALRGACVLAFLGIYLAGLLVLREIRGAIDWLCALLMLLLGLAIFTDFEFYLFRPDPFMTLCTAFGILAAVRLRHAPRKYSFLCGLAFGLAASFSLKMGLLCLLVPILCVWELWRSRTLEPLWVALFNALGFVVGILPVATWLLANDLFGSFKYWVIANNASKLNLIGVRTLETLDEGKLLTLLAVAGALAVIWTKPDDAASAWKPSRGLFVAALLAWLLPVVDPNHMTYNYQVFAMPGIVLGGILIMTLLEWSAGPKKIRFAAVVAAAAIFSYCMAGPTAYGTRSRDFGFSIPSADLRKLIELNKSDDPTCMALAPWHPIFARDVTSLHLAADHHILAYEWPSAAKEVYREMWPRAAADVRRKKPRMFVYNYLWTFACRDGLIGRQEFDGLMQFLQTNYRIAEMGQTDEVKVYLRKDP